MIKSFFDIVSIKSSVLSNSLIANSWFSLRKYFSSLHLTWDYYNYETNEWSRKLLEMGLVENVQREDLHPIEIATSYRRLKDECGLKDDDIGKLVGKSRSSITNQMRLLELSEEIQIALVKRDISQGHAKSLLSLSDNPDQQMILFGLIKDENLSVRMAEEMARKAKRKKKRKKAVKYELTGDEEQAITSLNIRYNDKIKLHKTSSSTGKIEIKYNSEDELERFLNELLKR